MKNCRGAGRTTNVVKGVVFKREFPPAVVKVWRVDLSLISRGCVFLERIDVTLISMILNGTSVLMVRGVMVQQIWLG